MAITLAALLEGPLGSALNTRVMPEFPHEITQVTLLEGIAEHDALRPGAVAVLGRAAEADAGGYRFDVLVRRAAERGVAALVLRQPTPRSLTAESLAQRGRLALLEVTDTADPLQVLDWLGAAVSGDSRSTLTRLAAAAAYEPAETLGDTEILQEISRLTGVQLDTSSTDQSGAPVEIDGKHTAWVVSTDLGDGPALAARIAATAISRVRTARERETLRPVRSKSSALAQLLLCSHAHLAAVSERAVEVGFEVHGWHTAVRLVVDSVVDSAVDSVVDSGVDSAVDSTSDDEDTLSRIEEDLVPIIASRGREHRASWTVARPDSSLVLVRTTRSDPGRDSDHLVRTTIDEILADLIARHPRARFRVGMATPHLGASGLRTSTEEARVALASARLLDEPVSIATFDSLGLRRMLAEWLVTDTARDTVSDLLAPLDALGPEKAAIAIETLHAYLDERGSLQRAAARLNVHRNAVVYRMAQICETLPHDLKDPDQRFALQLACRGRLMTLGRV
ncbi:MAG: helix-turn-helix domain-containing protein [Actinomycetes bacterium]|jgi:sugar diacid utilization regulator